MALAVAGCGKSPPGKRWHTVDNLPTNAGVKLEIGDKAGNDTAAVQLGGVAKDGTPVTVTITTPCGGHKVSFPFKRYTGSYAPSDREAVHVPEDQLPLLTFVRIDPSVKSPVKIGDRTVTSEAISEYGSNYADAYFWGLDCGAKLRAGDVDVTVPPWTAPTDPDAKAALQKKGNSLFITDSPMKCFEIRSLYYGDAASPPPTPVLLRGQTAYWVGRNIDFFMIEEERVTNSYAKAASKVSLQAVDCPGS